MARGRMLNKSVCASLKFQNLPDDTCRLLATWIISQLDVRGVFYGDPAMVKSYVFPRRADITAEDIARHLDAMQDAGLIVLFKAKGDTWQYWPGFADNQVGLRSERETPDFPEPPAEQPEPVTSDAGNLPDDCRKDAGHTPESIPQKRSEVNRREEKGKEVVDADTNVTPPTPARRAKTKPDTAKKPPTPSQEMFTALARACSIDLAMITPGQRGALNQTERMLREAGVKPEQIADFRAWWDREDWRGKRGDAPEPHQVREEWGRYLDGSKPAPKSPASVAVRVYE